MNAEKIKDFINKNIGYLVALFVSLAYIATSILTLGESGKSIAKIIGDGAASFFLGTLLTHVFSLQGILRGKKDPRMLSTEALHGEQVVRITSCINRLDDWCDKKTSEALRRERTKILARNAMRYEDYFDEGGIARDFEPRTCKTREERRREKLRYKTYKQAVAVRITPLLAGTLTGGGERVADPFDFGPDIGDYERSTVRRGAITKILLACVFGYYSVDLIVGFSYAELIWKIFQVGMYCTSGVIQTQQSFLFVVDQYRRRIVRAIDRLQEFESEMREHGFLRSEEKITEVKEGTENGG